MHTFFMIVLLAYIGYVLLNFPESAFRTFELTPTYVVGAGLLILPALYLIYRSMKAFLDPGPNSMSNIKDMLEVKLNASSGSLVLFSEKRFQQIARKAERKGIPITVAQTYTHWWNPDEKFDKSSVSAQPAQPDRPRESRTLPPASNLGKRVEDLKGQSVQSCIRVLKSADWTDWQSRRAAAERLENIGSPAVEPLVAMLDEDYTVIHGEGDIVVGTAIAILGRIGDPRAIEPLIGVLRNRGKRDREKAAKALMEFGDALIEPLGEALKDQSQLVPVIAIDLAGKTGDAHLIEPLSVNLRDQNPYVRSAAAGALKKIDDSGVIAVFTAALDDENEDVRKLAAASLEELNH